MKKALISSFEPVMQGYRVAQVVNTDEEFVVASGLFWVDCEDNVEQDKFWYNPETQEIVQIVYETSAPSGQTSGVESF